MEIIRKAEAKDLCRIAEILVFSKRLNYRPIFHNDEYSFGELQVVNVMKPLLTSSGIGASLLEFAIETFDVDHLWALEKNTRAIEFYKRHGFICTKIGDYATIYGTSDQLFQRNLLIKNG